MPKGNHRIAISKRLLKEGVMNLLKKKNINNISVSELCKLSEINRTTFYRHYQTPRDVLLEIELDFVKDLLRFSPASSDAITMKKDAVYTCNRLYENKDTVKLFIQNNTDKDLAILLQHFANVFLSSRRFFYKEQSIGTDSLRLIHTFIAYGGYALMRQWIIEDVPLSPEEVADLLLSLFNRDFSFK